MVLHRVGPDPDEALQGAVGNQLLALKYLHGCRASVIAVVEPPLYASAVVGDSGAQTNGGFHHVQRYRAAEKARYSYVQIIPHHCFVW